ncbi:T9SS type A sorting domain-containing protein [Winogradskyella sp. R77965]|uniref:T9SS type A sorting domain-containing protein n=1 Tax=Winogradskyella sp. R77965 TaxID=3093872 RepID=UPI0037DD9CCA
MRTLSLIISVLLYTHLGIAQSIEKFSIDSGGASVSSGNIQVLYTIGEVNVQEISAGGISISEGFINSSSNSALGISGVEMNDINIYPNPASDKVTIVSNNPIDSIEVYDILGKQIKTLKSTNQIDVSDLNVGIYLFKIWIEKQVQTKKVVVE